mgnify:CR=1 FL=1
MCIRDRLSTTTMLDKLGKLYGVPVVNTGVGFKYVAPAMICLLYTSDAADERSSVDLGGRRIIQKKKQREHNNSGESNQRKTELT